MGCVPVLWKIYQKIYLRFLLAYVNTISPKDLSESISFVSYWDCVAFLWKIYQKVYLSFLIGILHYFSGRYIRKYIFRFLLGLCTISLEDLSESVSFVSCWNCVQFLWKIYQKWYLPFLTGIVHHFLGRSLRKNIFRFFPGFSTISMEDLSKSRSSASYWDCVPFFWKIYQKLYLSFLIGIVYHFSGRSIIKYNFHFLLGLCTIFLEDLSQSISSVSYWDCLPFLWKIYHQV